MDSCWIGGLKATFLFDNLFFFFCLQPTLLARKVRRPCEIKVLRVCVPTKIVDRQEEHVPGYGTLCALQNPGYMKLPAGVLRSHPSQDQETMQDQGFHS